MRLSVRCRHVCPGEEKRILRKDAFCILRVTKKRILQPTPHRKAQSAFAPVAKLRFLVRVLRKSALCDLQTNQTVPFREVSPQNAVFREGDARKMRFSVRCLLQSAPFREVPPRLPR